jgi:hypothetical protein
MTGYMQVLTTVDSAEAAEREDLYGLALMDFGRLTENGDGVRIAIL